MAEFLQPAQIGLTHYAVLRRYFSEIPAWGVMEAYRTVYARRDETEAQRMLEDIHDLFAHKRLKGNL
jgi:hypothetical protein